MQKLNFSVIINAPKEKVWNIMLNEDTYKTWAAEFHPGSYYKGSWDEGSKILFVGPGENGDMGMVSRIKENRKYEYISIEHLGMFQNGIEDTSSENVKDWVGALENYTFKGTDGITELLVDMDINEEFKEMFQDMWPKALNKLKELAEK